MSIGAALVLLKRRTARLGARGSNGASLELAALPGVVTGTAVSVVGAPQAVPRAVEARCGSRLKTGANHVEWHADAVSEAILYVDGDLVWCCNVCERG